MKILFETPINLPFEKVRDRFTQDLFIHLAPPCIPFRLKKFDGCKVGDQVKIELGSWPFIQTWVSDITFEETNEKGWSFIDEGKVLPWPLSYWKHHHRVEKISDSECLIIDDIEYDCHLSTLTLFIKPFLWSIFAIRPKRYKEYFKE